MSDRQYTDRQYTDRQVRQEIQDDDNQTGPANHSPNAQPNSENARQVAPPAQKPVVDLRDAGPFDNVTDLPNMTANATAQSVNDSTAASTADSVAKSRADQ